MGINISIRTFDHCATCFTSAGSRAIRANNGAAFASGTMRDGRTVWTLCDMPRRALFTGGSGVERV